MKNQDSGTSTTLCATPCSSPSCNAVQKCKIQATYNALENQLVIALETGNTPEARRVFAIARGELPLDQQIQLVDLALEDYGVDLL